MKRLISIFICISLLFSLVAFSEEYKLLNSKSKGEEVVRLQERLIELGLFNGKADGTYGKKTKNAVIKFQRMMYNLGHKMYIDGVAGEITQSLLYDDEAVESLLEIKEDDTGLRVKALENRLYDLGFLQDKGDKKFEKDTSAALQNLQQVLLRGGYPGISVSGKADAVTRQALQDDLGAYGIKAPDFFDESDPLSLNKSYIYARHAILMDESGNILFEKNANTRAFPASLTKMMTLLIALEDEQPDKMVTMSEKMTKIPEASSKVPFHLGEYVSRRDLMYGMMLRSGNEAANALAISSKGSFSKFVEAMNKKAAELHMKSTRFVNVHGYHNKSHQSSAKDMALLAVKLMQNERAREIVSSESYRLAKTNEHRERNIENSSDILQPASPHYYPYAYGIKTGFTTPAGYCFAGYAEKDGKKLFAVVLNCRTRDMSFVDCRRLFEYGFEKQNKTK